MAVSKEKSGRSVPASITGGSLRFKALPSNEFLEEPVVNLSSATEMLGDTLSLFEAPAKGVCGTQYLLGVGSIKSMLSLSLHQVIPEKQLPKQRRHFPDPLHVRLNDWFTNKM